MSKLPKKTNPYLKKSSRIAYEDPWKKLIVDELELNGSKVNYSYMDNRGGVEILAMDEEGQVALIGQWRHPLQAYSWEFPAGGLEDGEDVLACAKRELLEEAGVEAEEWIYLGSMYPISSHANAESHAYLARKLKKGESQPDPDEDLTLIWHQWDEVLQACLDGDIKEGLSIFTVFKAQAHLQSEG
jgi:8-oxo-dGTP pyrophosphatase MutT (NUDIX family)